MEVTTLKVMGLSIFTALTFAPVKNWFKEFGRKSTLDHSVIEERPKSNWLYFKSKESHHFAYNPVDKLLIQVESYNELVSVKRFKNEAVNLHLDVQRYNRKTQGYERITQAQFTQAFNKVSDCFDFSTSK